MTSESLDAHIRVQVERIHAGSIRPERIVLRMLLPVAEKMDPPYPRAKDDKNDPRPRERLRDTSRRHTESIRTVLKDLATEELVRSVDVEVRHTAVTPTFKFYLLNGVQALHGVYQVIERPMSLDTGEVIDALDVLGVGASLTHHVKDEDPDSAGSVFVDSLREGFDSVWNLLAE